MTDALLARLTALANACDDEEIKAWIARHIAEDVRVCAVRRAVRLPRCVVRRRTRAEAFSPYSSRDVTDLVRLQVAENERGLAKLLE